MQYTEEEIIINKKLDYLFNKWRAILEEKNIDITDFVNDGIYPYYTKQKKRILFIARESIELSGEEYIVTLHQAYKEKRVAGKSLDQNRFHALMLYLAFAINNNLPEWASLPLASEIADQFATAQGVSFAFMNLSKLSNESGHWQSDWPLINKFVNASSNDQINLLEQQISIIEPEIIITMNLGDKLHRLGKLEHIAKNSNANICCYQLSVNGKETPLFDMYHFSALKSMSDYFYLPLKAQLMMHAVMAIPGVQLASVPD